MLISSVTIRQLFADDFKEVLLALTVIDDVLQSGSELEGLMANLDLVLR